MAGKAAFRTHKKLKRMSSIEIKNPLSLKIASYNCRQRDANWQHFLANWRCIAQYSELALSGQPDTNTSERTWKGDDSACGHL